jgi:hypothetical protein
MSQSAEVKDLFTALAKAQSEIKGAVKDSENPFFHSKYADLESVWDACRDALTKNGLSVIQTTEYNPDVGTCIVTTLGHSSGQWIKGSLPIMAAKKDPQGIGSAITYSRRYALAAIVGVVQVDDDGEGAMGRSKDGDKSKNKAPNSSATDKVTLKPTEKQINRLYALKKAAALKTETVLSWMDTRWGIRSTDELNVSQYDELCKAIETGQLKNVSLSA